MSGPKQIRLRVRVAQGAGGELFWASCVVDRQQRGLAVTQQQWSSTPHLWSVTHIASGRAIVNGVELRAARALLLKLCARRVKWTLPMRRLLASLSAAERTYLRGLQAAARGGK